MIIIVSVRFVKFHSALWPFLCGSDGRLKPPGQTVNKHPLNNRKPFRIRTSSQKCCQPLKNIQAVRLVRERPASKFFYRRLVHPTDVFGSPFCSCGKHERRVSNTIPLGGTVGPLFATRASSVLDLGFLEGRRGAIKEYFCFCKD